MRHVPREWTIRARWDLDQLARHRLGNPGRRHIRCRSQTSWKTRRLGNLYCAGRSGHAPAYWRPETERLRRSGCLQIQADRRHPAIHAGQRPVQVAPKKRAPAVAALAEKITSRCYASQGVDLANYLCTPLVKKMRSRSMSAPRLEKKSRSSDVR